MSYQTPNLDASLQKKFITTLTDSLGVVRGKRVNPYSTTIRKSQKLKNCFTKVVSYDPGKHLWPFVFENSTKKIFDFFGWKNTNFWAILAYFSFLSI